MYASIHLLLVAVMVRSGLAVKCINCDSVSNPLCGEEMKDKHQIAEECNREKLMELQSRFGDPARHWLLNISDSFYRYSKSDDDVPQAICQKLVGVDEENKDITVRRCQLANVQCADTNFTLVKKYENRLQMKFCEVCDEDGCNGSSKTQFSAAIIGVAIFTIPIYLLL